VSAASLKRLVSLLAAAAMWTTAGLPPVRAAASTVAGSVRKPDASGQIGTARVVRTTLTAEELGAPVSFSVSLRMRDLAGLQARVAAGETIPFAELESRYLPLASDYARVAAWLQAEGLAAPTGSRAHLNLFASGTTAAVARALGVTMARVASVDGEFTSAVSDPAVPADLAGVVLSVNGLQPEFRPHRVRTAPQARPADDIGNDVFVTPDNVQSAYQIPASLTGAGQTIAIISQAAPTLSDMTEFWTQVGSAQTVNNLTVITLPDYVASGAMSGDKFETAIDIQWAGALAPGAKLRDYVSYDAFNGFAQVLDDLGSYPTLSVVSSSYGDLESYDEANSAGEITSVSQTLAALASQGVSVFSASGDNGSNPVETATTDSYSASAPRGVTFPASDPSVTGVGGTTVEYNVNASQVFSYGGELVWDDLNPTDGSMPGASGGGVSSLFTKPSWQTGGSVLAGQTMRCVPDVAGISNANESYPPNFSPAVIYDDGVLVYQGSTTPQNAVGTSVATPVWAAIGALVNQARAGNSLGHVGLLNPHLYPLQGTAAFNDITAGNNGAYDAGAGYDLCTGLGSPNVTALVAALTASSGSAPSYRLVNVSTRAEVETGANIEIAGFVLQGPGGSTKTVLVRGVGPALTALGVSGALAAPMVSVYDSTSTLIASDTGWSNPPVAGTSTSGATYRTATAADMSAVGAFALTAGSADSAMVLTLPIGSYTVQVAGQDFTSGVGLAEVYELSTSVPEVLSNISARCFVGTGAEVAISGFVVQGNAPVKLLVRGVGPALAAFGLSGLLAQPSIGIFDSKNDLIVSDAGWGNPLVPGTSASGATYRPATAADMTAAGAFALTAGSADSAIVVTVPAGSYTAVISGVNSTSGTALAEVYELPSN
jgi:kumamolisin